ncbi:hypothetical protein OESDEN_05165 [Oesophagostomum dentatum]|uniref:Uncharacterized protein n=1 Tax=Oesophagostomum dentatum TaxID=61180 RepID=A0A0B1TC84_OESDE|nr:hypothetical protein OESDEN_05165 [Oesophagostomum dentatum]
MIISLGTLFVLSNSLWFFSVTLLLRNVDIIVSFDQNNERRCGYATNWAETLVDCHQRFPRKGAAQGLPGGPPINRPHSYGLLHSSGHATSGQCHDNRGGAHDHYAFSLLLQAAAVSFPFPAFYVIFHSCELAEKDYRSKHGLHEDDDYKGRLALREQRSNLINFIFKYRFQNIMDSPREALMRMIIMSVGEFGAVYKNPNDCKSRVALQGKVLLRMWRAKYEQH